MKKITELAKFLEEEIEYDGSGGQDCPHCGKNIIEHNSWIDHKTSLATNVTEFLGFERSYYGGGVNGLIYDAIEAYCPIGEAKKDAPILAKAIIESL